MVARRVEGQAAIEPRRDGEAVGTGLAHQSFDVDGFAGAINRTIRENQSTQWWRRALRRIPRIVTERLAKPRHRQLLAMPTDAHHVQIPAAARHQPAGLGPGRQHHAAIRRALGHSEPFEPLV